MVFLHIDLEKEEFNEAMDPDKTLPTPPLIDVGYGLPVVSEESTNMVNQTKTESGKVLVNNLTYNSMKFGPISAKNQEEAKHIIELFNFKVHEREKKDLNGKRSTRALCMPAAVIRARAVLPSYVVEYLDHAFKKKNLKMRSDRTSSGLQNSEPVPLKVQFYKCGLCSKMYGTTQDIETHFETYHNIGHDIPKLYIE